VRVVGSSRTDTGVHADHQVATFRSTENVDIGRLHRSLNAVLPQSIGILKVSLADPQFHPIFSAKGKVYRYRIWREVGMPPYVRPFVWHLPYPLAWDLFIKNAQFFIGRYDYSSFCASDSSAKSKVREVYDVVVEERGPLVDFWISGEGFLKQMIRAIVGTLVEIAGQKKAFPAIPDLIKARDRTLAGQTAPALGLSLVRVCYDGVPSLQHLIRRGDTGFSYPIF